MTRGKGGRSRGYTIVETMIFLAVSASMFISAMAFINGRQGRTEFSAAVRDFEASINDIASDVSTGYYASPAADAGSQRCSVVGNTPSFTSPTAAAQRGASQGCIFIGKAIHFAPARTDGGGEYDVYSLAGTRYARNVPGIESKDIDDSQVKIIPDSTDTLRLGGGATFGCVKYGASAAVPLPLPPTVPSVEPCTSMTASSTGLAAFFTTFQGVKIDSSDKGSGSNQTELRVSNRLSGINLASAAAKNAVEVPGTPSAAYTKPNLGMYICIQSNGSNQHAMINLGGRTSRFSSVATIYSGKCSA